MTIQEHNAAIDELAQASLAIADRAIGKAADAQFHAALTLALSRS